MNENRSGPEQVRDNAGKFLPGQSGNPSGRPPGLMDKRVAMRNALLDPLLPDAVEKLTAAVGKGERWAIELVLSYSLPKPRPVDADEIADFEQRLTELEEIAARKH